MRQRLCLHKSISIQALLCDLRSRMGECSMTNEESLKVRHNWLSNHIRPILRYATFCDYL